MRQKHHQHLGISTSSQNAAVLMKWLWLGGLWCWCVSAWYNIYKIYSCRSGNYRRHESQRREGLQTWNDVIMQIIQSLGSEINIQIIHQSLYMLKNAVKFAASFGFDSMHMVYRYKQRSYDITGCNTWHTLANQPWEFF